MSAWLNLDGRDVVAFMFASLAGYAVGRLLPPGALAIYASILVSYHLFLGWLVLFGKRDAAISMPIFSTIVTHIAFMAAVIAIGMGRHFVPYFSLVRYGLASLAIFERGWLFSANEVELQKPKQETEPETPVVVASGDDEQAWLQYLARQKRGSRPAGASLKAEYEQWMRVRMESRAAEAARGRDAGRV